MIVAIILGFVTLLLLFTILISIELKNEIQYLKQLNTEYSLEEEKIKDEYDQLVKGLRKLLGDEP